MFEAPAAVVSAANHEYYRTLCQLLLSAERHRVNDRCAVLAFDLGLSNGDRAHLRERFPWCAVETVAFANLPPHVRQLDMCAWKPVVIEETLRVHGGLVLWLDSATVVRAPLEQVFDRIARDGIIALAGQSHLSRWCHEATFAFMRTAPELRKRRCRAAGVLGFDGRRADVQALVTRWREYCLVEECIAPAGATRGNHRYDQAVLNNLLAEFDALRGRADEPVEDVDISSVRPADWVSTRNKVAPWVPLACDPLVRAWYRTCKRLDRAALAARAAFSARAADR